MENVTEDILHHTCLALAEWLPMTSDAGSPSWLHQATLPSIVNAIITTPSSKEIAATGLM